MSERYASENIIEKIVNLDIGVLINNAGVNTRGLFKDVSEEDIREMALVNTYPYTFLMRGLIPQM